MPPDYLRLECEEDLDLDGERNGPAAPPWTLRTLYVGPISYPRKLQISRVLSAVSCATKMTRSNVWRCARVMRYVSRVTTAWSRQRGPRLLYRTA